MVLPGAIDDFQDPLPIIMHVARVEELRVKSNSNLQAQHPQFSLTTASSQNREIHSLASAWSSFDPPLSSAFITSGWSAIT